VGFCRRLAVVSEAHVRDALEEVKRLTNRTAVSGRSSTASPCESEARCFEGGTNGRT
jgi:hypothetical protein